MAIWRRWKPFIEGLAVRPDSLARWRGPERFDARETWESILWGMRPRLGTFYFGFTVLIASSSAGLSMGPALAAALYSYAVASVAYNCGARDGRRESKP